MNNETQPSAPSKNELMVLLFQLAKNHQHRSLQTLLNEAREIAPSVSDEQWHEASVSLANRLYENDYMGLQSQAWLYKKRRRPAKVDQGPEPE